MLEAALVTSQVRMLEAALVTSQAELEAVKAALFV